MDPFAGSGTTLLAAENVGLESVGVEAHPFVFRIASAKLLRRSSPDDYLKLVRAVRTRAARSVMAPPKYPKLIRKCYTPEALAKLHALRVALDESHDESAAWHLVWLTLAGILRLTSCVGTAQWQYVLPKKEKKRTLDAFDAFDALAQTIARDMRISGGQPLGRPTRVILGDARTCEGIPDGFADLVLTSPPYPNNYDYADATRLEMSFFGEIGGWGDLQSKVRQHLVRSCSQHVPPGRVDLEAKLRSDELAPIRSAISEVCHRLARIRLTKGGKKTYHLMVACYFRDLAQVWRALRRVCAPRARVCFVVGDSAPYGVYVPVMEWLERLAVAAGFGNARFEKTRDRNVKWRNRKHRVPLCEGRLWVHG
ncbi:MAG: DNA modification methylase [Planctomycetes bacterium]|nr:DNA modification methylase [Planctomycetota bacterium]